MMAKTLARVYIYIYISIFTEKIINLANCTLVKGVVVLSSKIVNGNKSKLNKVINIEDSFIERII